MLFQLAIRARLPDSSEGYPLRPDRRDTRPSQRGPLSRPQPGFIDSPWIARMDIANGTLADGLSHDFDKARYLSGEEFVSVISKITPVTIKPDGDFFVDGGRSMHLAELSDGIPRSVRIGFPGSSSAMRDHSASPTPERSSCGSDTTTMSRSSWRSPMPTRRYCPATCSNIPGIASSR